MAGETEQNPVVEAFEHALAGLGAAPLAAGDDKVVVGYEELELTIPWPELTAALEGGDPARWSETVAELVIAAAARARLGHEQWSDLKYRVMPLLLSREAAEQLAGRQPDVLAFPYADVLLIAIADSVEGGWRYLLRSQVEEWGGGGAPVIAAALENLRRETPKQGVVQQLGGDHFALDTGDGLDASRLLILDELVPAAHDEGLLAVVPARDVLSFVPFSKRGCGHLRALINLAAKCQASWAHPISASLFYIAPHTALHVEVTRDPDNTPRLRFPAELVRIQAGLAERGLW